MEVIESSIKRPLDDQNLDKETISVKKFCLEKTQPYRKDSVLCYSKDELVKVSGPRKAPHVRASEQDGGISEYISDLPGFFTLMFSDFSVSEIDLQGRVVRVADLEKPQNPERAYNVTNMDKDARKNLHVALPNTFSCIESNIEDKEDKKFVVVKNFNHNSRAIATSLNVASEIQMPPGGEFVVLERPPSKPVLRSDAPEPGAVSLPPSATGVPTTASASATVCHVLPIPKGQTTTKTEAVAQREAHEINFTHREEMLDDDSLELDEVLRDALSNGMHNLSLGLRREDHPLDLRLNGFDQPLKLE